MNDLVHTAAVGAAAASTALLGPLAILLALADERAPDPVLRVWCNNLLRGAGVREDVQGLERLPPGHAVYVCNHQSNFDPVFIFARLGKHLRFIAKRELFEIPIFGAALKATGMIPVDRTGSERDREAIEAAVDAVRTRVSILFFAEGTRDPAGVLRPFKKGAAVLAIQAGVPLVPLAVAGTKEVMTKKHVLIRGGRPVVLRVGEPIATAGMKLEERDTLTDRAHAAVAELLDAANARVEEMSAHA
ncbi:MAG TPA: lysophospholipid acyltransferase family protein [Myxococcaceae bacterium]|nr:lysophospholipid acyltransferase family protein [Myxococcaceae bacterium]